MARPRWQIFGVAHVSEHTLSRSWTTGGEFVAGTLPYMSPEQTDGVRNDPRVDVYALGAVLYRMLTGRTYVEFDQRDTPRAQAENVQRICGERPVAPSLHGERIPPWLDKVVLKALAKRPEARYATMDGLRAALLQPPRPRARSAPVARPLPVVLVPEAPAAGLEGPPSSELHGGPSPSGPQREEEPGPELAVVPVEQGEPAAGAIPLPLPVAALIVEAAPAVAAVESALPAGPPPGAEGRPSGEAPVEPPRLEGGLQPEEHPLPAPSGPIPAAAAAPSRPGPDESAPRPGRVRAPLPAYFWPVVLGGGVLLVAIVIGLGMLLLSGGPGEATSTATIAAVVRVTDTATPASTPLPTETPVPPADTPAPTPTPRPPWSP
jgi:serine/threonine-protein kinase